MNDNSSDAAYEGDLALLRRIYPININYWARRELLTPLEAVLLYYGIDPKGPHGISEYGFEWQIRNLDEDGIYELICDSFKNKSLNIHLGSISVRYFCSWLQEKKFIVPECIRSSSHNSHCGSKEPVPLSTIPDVLKINFSDLSSSVLAALGANVIAEICIRKADKENNENLKTKDVLKTNMVKELLTLCAASEGKGEKSDDTIRGYIEHRFKES